MKKYIKPLSLIAIFFATMINTIHAQESIKIGTDVSPPFTNLNAEGKLEGFDIDLGMALCKEIKITCEFVEMPFIELLPALKEGRIQAVIAEISNTEERLREFSFSKPYIDATGQAIKLKTSPFDKISKPFYGKKVGVRKGSIWDQYLTHNYSNNLKIIPFTHDMQAIEALKNKEIDFVFTAQIFSKILIENDPNTAFEFVGPEIISRRELGEGAAIVTAKDNQELADKFTSAINKMRSDRSFQELSFQYFKMDIYARDK